MQQKSNVLKVLPVLFGFFIMGFCDIIGVSVNYVKNDFNLSESMAAILPMMLFGWFFLLSIPTSVLMNKLGRKTTVQLSNVITFCGMLIPVFSYNYTTALLTFALLGIGNTILQVALNPLLTNVISGDRLSSTLTTGQFIKAISSFVGPIIAGFCSLNFGGWQNIFIVYAAAILISTIWLQLTHIDETNEQKNTISIGSAAELLKDKTILAIFLGIVCIVGLDVGMNTVIPKLLMERLDFTKEAAGYGSSWHFAARTIGTAVGAILLVKMSEKIYFRANMILCLSALIVLSMAQSYALMVAMVCIIAFTSSSIFAVLYTFALKRQPQKADAISGLLITGVAGGGLFPMLMGVSADAVGNQIGSLIIIALTMIYLVVCSFSIKS